MRPYDKNEFEALLDDIPSLTERFVKSDHAAFLDAHFDINSQDPETGETLLNTLLTWLSIELQNVKKSKVLINQFVFLADFLVQQGASLTIPDHFDVTPQQTINAIMDDDEDVDFAFFYQTMCDEFDPRDAFLRLYYTPLHQSSLPGPLLQSFGKLGGFKFKDHLGHTLLDYLFLLKRDERKSYELLKTMLDRGYYSFEQPDHAGYTTFSRLLSEDNADINGELIIRLLETHFKREKKEMPRPRQIVLHLDIPPITVPTFLNPNHFHESFKDNAIDLLHSFKQTCLNNIEAYKVSLSETGPPLIPKTAHEMAIAFNTFIKQSPEIRAQIATVPQGKSRLYDSCYAGWQHHNAWDYYLEDVKHLDSDFEAYKQCEMEAYGYFSNLMHQKHPYREEDYSHEVLIHFRASDGGAGFGNMILSHNKPPTIQHSRIGDKEWSIFEKYHPEVAVKPVDKINALLNTLTNCQQAYLHASKNKEEQVSACRALLRGHMPTREVAVKTDAVTQQEEGLPQLGRPL